jgi:hypothetical protein
LSAASTFTVAFTVSVPSSATAIAWISHVGYSHPAVNSSVPAGCTTDYGLEDVANAGVSLGAHTATSLVSYTPGSRSIGMRAQKANVGDIINLV